jgi:precorrin-4 methylase
MATTEQKQARLEQLEEILSSGIRSTTVDGVTTNFGSPSEIRAEMTRLKRDLGILRPRKRARGVFMGHR